MPSRHDLRAHRDMYRLPGKPPLIDRDFDRYAQRNDALDATLPKIISDYFAHQPISLWYSRAPLIREIPEAAGTALRRQLTTGLRAEFVSTRGQIPPDRLSLLPFVSPRERADILATALRYTNAALHETAASYIRLADPSYQSVLIDRILSGSTSLARARAIQGIDALPETQRAKVVQQGLRDPSLDVVTAAAMKIDVLPPNDQAAARAPLPAIIQTALLHTKAEYYDISKVAGMIEYVASEDQPALRTMLFTVLKSRLDVPTMPVTPKLGPRLSWIFQHWLDPDSQPTPGASPPLSFAKLIDDVPAENQPALRALLPALLRESLAENQGYAKRALGVSAIRYASVEMRTHFLRVALESQDHLVRDAAVAQIQYLPEHDRAPLLQKALRDQSPSVRKTAICHIDTLPDAERTPLVLSALSDRSREVIDVMIEHLDCVTPAEWQPVIEFGLESRVPDVVTAVSARLSYIPDDEAARIRSKYPRYFHDLRTVATNTPLYTAIGTDRFLRKGFAKTGSDLTLLDRPSPQQKEASLREKAVIRTIPLTAYLLWRKAYEAADVWKAHGFDYVPIEPILRVAPKSTPRSTEIHVAAGVISGPNVGVWEEEGGTCMAEIYDSIERVHAALEELGIDHRHPHLGNFVLLFDRDPEGVPIVTSPPRVYLIDFDQAVTREKQS